MLTEADFKAALLSPEQRKALKEIQLTIEQKIQQANAQYQQTQQQLAELEQVKTQLQAQTQQLVAALATDESNVLPGDLSSRRFIISSKARS